MTEKTLEETQAIADKFARWFSNYNMSVAYHVAWGVPVVRFEKWGQINGFSEMRCLHFRAEDLPDGFSEAEIADFYKPTLEMLDGLFTNREDAA